MPDSCGSTAEGQCSSAEGSNTLAAGFASHTEGANTLTALGGVAAHAEGSFTSANGIASHAEGGAATAGGIASHAEGGGTAAGGDASHAEGTGTLATGASAHAEGDGTFAGGASSHAEGSGSWATGEDAHAEGIRTRANGAYSHTEGFATLAEGERSHAEGSACIASGTSAHAEGELALAIGTSAHAEGGFTAASGGASHAEGSTTNAVGASSHSEGFRTTAGGIFSHAEGFLTSANAEASHSEGIATVIAEDFFASHIMGEFGSADEDHSWFLVNNGIKAKISGNTGIGFFTGGTVVGPGDYAEYFETADGRPLDAGCFVTLEGDKIRRASSGDDYILGITSAAPGILGNSSEFCWKRKYLTDEWGRALYEEAALPAAIDQAGTVITPERKVKIAAVNPEWDENIDYIPRSKRPEWAAVGLMGQLLVRDDGTCRANGYCRPDDDGVATASERGYRVMKRTGANQILVMFR